MKHSLMISGILLSLSISQAQTLDVSAKLPDPIFEIIHSNKVNHTYNIFITLPPNYSPKDKLYPVLYYLDAWTYTGLLNSIASRQMYYHHIDPIILVGISYDSNFKGKSRIRWRDYVPSLESKDTIHRADDFLEFIKTELIPQIENKYSVDQNDRGIIGHSLGGLFTTWVLKQEPELFQKIGISSPSLWYQDKALLNNEELRTSIAVIKNMKVLISTGGLENEPMISEASELFNLLKSNENIHVSNLIFENENHYTVSTVAYNRALTYFYQNQYKALFHKASELYIEKKYDESIKYVLQAFQLDSAQITFNDRLALASLYALSGKTDESFEQLFIIAEMRIYEHYTTLTKDGDLESLHSDKRWKELSDFYKD